MRFGAASREKQGQVGQQGATCGLSNESVTDRQTHQPTDTASYRGTLSHLKRRKRRKNEEEKEEKEKKRRKKKEAEEEEAEEEGEGEEEGEEEEEEEEEELQ